MQAVDEILIVLAISLIASFTVSGQLGTTSIIRTSITFNFPVGSSLNALVAQFGIDADANAFVGATKQISGVTANNFTNGVSYSITSETRLTKIDTASVNLVNEYLRAYIS